MNLRREFDRHQILKINESIRVVFDRVEYQKGEPFEYILYRNDDIILFVENNYTIVPDFNSNNKNTWILRKDN